MSEETILNFKSYNGNPTLKRSGVQIAWTEEMMKEWLKCKADPIYFSEKYIKIVHVDRGFIPIELYDYQKDVIKKITNNRKVILNASRQIGKTTLACCVILHYILFNEHKTVGLLAHKADGAREILDRIKQSFEALPSWLQQGVEIWNKGDIKLENGCKVIAAATTSSSIRGKSCSLIYIDECAFVENWSDFYASTYPTISSGETTKLLFTSTPKGLNHFYKFMEDAKNEKNGFEWSEVPWWEIPSRNEKWKQETLEAMSFDHEKFAQEFECSFIGSSGTLIGSAALKSLVSKTPIAKSDGIFQYDVPTAGHTYVLIADVSRGKGLDYSAFQVIDVTEMPYKQVCVYKNNMITPVDYSEVIYRIAKNYNEASILVEINDIGGQVADVLFMEYECENLISTESAGRAGKRVSAGFGRNIDRGIRTTKQVKSIGCSILKLLVEQNQIILHDNNTIQELSRFSRKGGSYEAESGWNDDLVMGLVLFAWLSDQKYFHDMTDINTLTLLRDRTSEEIADSMLPFFMSDGTDEYEPETFEYNPRPEFSEF